MCIQFDNAARLPRRILLQSAAFLALSALADDAFAAPQDAVAHQSGQEFTLGNAALSARWAVDENSLRTVELRSKTTGATLPAADLFRLVFADGHSVTPSQLRLVDGPRFERVRPSRHAIRGAERLGGQALRARFADPASGATIDWRAVLLDGTSYLRQEVAITAGDTALPISEIILIEREVSGASVSGSVKGSPIVAGDWFLGFEHPLAESAVEGAIIRSSFKRALPIPARHRFGCSAVIGATAAGQLRRDFLRYVETERAHPYRPFFHYNSWFDIGFQNRYTSDDAVDAIDHFGTELATKRGVTIDSFLFDDGWDDPRTLWGFVPGFPDGFGPARKAAAKFKASPGVWLSPWGGYPPELPKRLEFGRPAGYETNDRGFALSGPKYYRRFRDVCVEMIRKYDVNQFKFDGTGNVNEVIPGSAFDSDFHAMISLIGELREVKPDLFVNLTTGTWPSPFWTQHADSIWRGGYDTNFAGAGGDRQRWITYRDQQTYHGVVQRGPLYPLNSLMLHGIVYARHANRLNSDPDNAFTSEVRSYFGSGTGLQEVYVTPSLLSADNWGVLAESANWSRRNADILVDTHWIGGDPAKAEAYGWAAWSPRGGIVTLRNPSDKPQTFDLDIAAALELPTGAPTRFAAHSPWKSDATAGPIALAAGAPVSITLQPFEVRTFDCRPTG